MASSLASYQSSPAPSSPGGSSAAGPAQSSAGGSPHSSAVGSAVGSAAGSAVGSAVGSTAASTVGSTATPMPLLFVDNTKPLLRAVNDGNVEGVRHLFNQARDADVYDVLLPNGARTTLLHLAINNKDVEMVNVLVLLGFDLNRRDKDGVTALALAGKRKWRKGREAILTAEKKRKEWERKSSDKSFANIIAPLLDDSISVEEFQRQITKDSASEEKRILTLTNSKQQTIWHIAAEGGRGDAIKEKLNVVMDRMNTNGKDKKSKALHASMFAPDQEHRTPFCTAAGSGNEAVCEFFLSRKGFDMHKWSTKSVQRVPLDLPFIEAPHHPVVAAVLHGHVGTLELCLRHPGWGSPNILYIHRALAFAASSNSDNRVDIMRRLLAAKAHPNYADKSLRTEEQTALWTACSVGHQDAVDLLLASKAFVNRTDRQGNSALWLAVKHKKWNAVQSLLNAPSIQISDAKALLRLAESHESSFNVVQTLKSHAGSQAERYPNGRTKLHMAMLDEKSACMAHGVCKQAVEKEGVDPSALDHRGETALFAALRHEGDECVATLLKLRCDPNEGLTSELTTALYETVKRGSTTKTKLLLEHGASVNVRNVHELPLFIAALEEGKLDKDGVQALLDAKASMDDFQKLHKPILAYCQRVDVAEQLLNFGVDVNEVNKEGRSAIFYPLPLDVARYLISKGCDVNKISTDHVSRTPLHAVTMINGFGKSSYRTTVPDMVKLLLDNKADHMKADRNGQLPVFFAASCRDEELAVRCLRIYHLQGPLKGQFDHVDRWMCSPLHWAASQGTAGAVHFLCSVTERWVFNPATKKRPADYIPKESTGGAKKRRLLDDFEKHFWAAEASGFGLPPIQLLGLKLVAPNNGTVAPAHPAKLAKIKEDYRQHSTASVTGTGAPSVPSTARAPEEHRERGGNCDSEDTLSGATAVSEVRSAVTV